MQLKLVVCYTLGNTYIIFSSIYKQSASVNMERDKSILGHVKI